MARIEQQRQQLAALVDDLLAQIHDARAAVEHTPDASTIIAMTLGRYGGEQLITRNAPIEEVADRIQTLLGPPYRFEGSWEVVAFLLDKLATLDDDLHLSASRAALAEALSGPVDRWPFQLPMFPLPPFVLEYDVGGPCQLSFKGALITPSVDVQKLNAALMKNATVQGRVQFPESGPPRYPVVVLSGSVEAATPEGALRRAERIVDTVLGATRALGLSTYIESRSPFGRAAIKLADGGLQLASAYADRIASTSLAVPPDLTELETSLHSSGDLPGAIGRYLRTLDKTLVGASERAAFVRNSCRLAINAEASLDFGVLIALAFSCMEGLLVGSTGSDSVTAKLTEAVAYSLGRDHDERESLRREVKELYKVRSLFVHQGQAAEAPTVRRRTLAMMYRVLRREMEALPEQA